MSLIKAEQHFIFLNNLFYRRLRKIEAKLFIAKLSIFKRKKSLYFSIFLSSDILTFRISEKISSLDPTKFVIIIPNIFDLSFKLTDAIHN